MHDRVMINAEAPDGDADVRFLSELACSLAQSNEVHGSPASRRGRSEGGDPQHAIGLARSDETLSVEAPGVMDRGAGAESGSHWEAGCPPASRENARAIVRRGQEQCRETGGFVQVADKPMQHLDFERSETFRRPNRDAEPGASQCGGDRVE